jgi:hypothetical protein
VGLAIAERIAKVVDFAYALPLDIGENRSEGFQIAMNIAQDRFSQILLNVKFDGSAVCNSCDSVCG